MAVLVVFKAHFTACFCVLELGSFLWLSERSTAAQSRLAHRFVCEAVFTKSRDERANSYSMKPSVCKAVCRQIRTQAHNHKSALNQEYHSLNVRWVVSKDHVNVAKN